MTSFEIYVFCLCFIVFTLLTAMFSYLITALTKQELELIETGLRDMKIQEEFEVASVGQGSATGIVKVGDKIKGIKINDGEWVYFTRQYQLLDQLLCVRKGDSVTLKVVDSNGVEQERNILFSEDSYFVKYD